ncbi:hypothetical protein Tco_0462452 [Tanacetum coccineum]
MFMAFVSPKQKYTNKVKSSFTGAYITSPHFYFFNNAPEKEVSLLDLEQIDDVDIEEMDINWQIAMIAI